jgi:hypothetical protein
MSTPPLSCHHAISFLSWPCSVATMVQLPPLGTTPLSVIRATPPPLRSSPIGINLSFGGIGSVHLAHHIFIHFSWIVHSAAKTKKRGCRALQSHWWHAESETGASWEWDRGRGGKGGSNLPGLCQVFLIDQSWRVSSQSVSHNCNFFDHSPTSRPWSID